MKGAKRRQSQEASPSPLLPPPVTAVDGGFEKTGNGLGNPSPYPFLDSTQREGPTPQNLRILGKEPASASAEGRRAAVAEGKRPVVEEDAEDEDGGGEKGGDDEPFEEGLPIVGDEEEEADEAAEEDGDGEAETPKLAEGYYEIEAVRKKRVRKGQVQYLIKWRGWPETANTWEPFDNLSFVSDVVDAFEESLRSGKKSARRRKRKSGSASTQSKKKPQPSSSSPTAATYSVPARNYQLTEGPIISPANENFAANSEADNAGGTTTTEPASATEDREEHTELNLKLSELIGSAAVRENSVDRLPGQSQEAPGSEQGSLTNGLESADGAEPIQFGRSTGSKRRKSGSVRRFKKETPTSVTGVGQNAAAENGSCGITGNQGTQTPNNMDNGSLIVSRTDHSKDICAITEIVRPISFSTCISNNSQNVSLTFKAKRSDGKEVTVDNKFLKANNPLLLVNYYEQHLRYNATE